MIESDERRAAARSAIAEKQGGEYDLAVAACGPAMSYCKWTLHDTTGVLPDRVVYACSYHDGSGIHPSPEEAFPDLGELRGDEWGEVKGVRHYYARFQLWWGPVEKYQPEEAAGLAARREARERSKRQAEQAAHPLFFQDPQAELF